MTIASSSVHPFLTKAATRPPLEPTTVSPSPSPPQPTAQLGATQRGDRGGRRPPPPSRDHVHQLGAATGKPLTLCTGTAVGSGTNRITASPPNRRQQCTLARAARPLRPAAAAAVPAQTRGRWSTAGSGWYVRQAPPHLDRRGGAHLPAAAARGWGASETLRHHRPPRWPPQTAGRHAPAKGDRGS